MRKLSRISKRLADFVCLQICLIDSRSHAIELFIFMNPVKAWVQCFWSKQEVR
jgi:hypothetical protein